jgi:hypothetical protein
MKLTHCLFVLTIALVLYSCAPAKSTVLPTQVEIRPPSPTSIQPAATIQPILTPTGTATLMPPATLEPEKARETISRLLQQYPEDCLAPCFWGITPGQTKLGEAKDIFTNLGLEINGGTYQSKEFYGVDYAFDNISMSAHLVAQDNLVKNLTIDLHPEKQQVNVPRKWLAYSPETLIKRYGLPSKVNFIVDRGPRPAYTMDMYFDTVDLIIGYSSYDLEPKFQVCPLINQIDYIRIWLGHEPQNPPPFDATVISLENATSLMMEEFSTLMTGNPKKACFNLKAEMFP